MDKLIYASASALARAIRTKKVSSEEVVDAYLQRIDEVNPKLNAVVQLTADAARAETFGFASFLARIRHRDTFCRARKFRSVTD